jgi:hypothetical protein
VNVHRALRVVVIVGALTTVASLSAAQPPEPATVPLTVAAGRSIEVVIDQRITITSVGQPVAGNLVEPLYAFDREMVPAGTRVLGHVAALEDASKVVRTRAILSGDLTPKHIVVLQFDTLVFDDGRTVAIQTKVLTEIPHLKRTSAPPQPPANETEAGESTVHRAEREGKDYVKQSVESAKQKGRDVLAEITQPGRTERMKQAVTEKLPYHPQAISAGTGYHAALLAPIDFGAVQPTEPAGPDDRPAPSSILKARLVTTMDSSKTPRGTAIRALVTEPVFSADHRLIFPEGTMLEGEVTYATPAKRFHRNGQLRFLFERVQMPSGEATTLLASLQSAHTSEDDRMVLDDEGGAKLENSKTRFIAPALALLALHGTLDRGEHPDPDGDGHMIESSNPGAVTAGGFFGLGLLGIPLSHLVPPIGVGLSIFGAARTVYANILAKGREVQFPAETPVQLQLAPGPSGTR